MPKVLLFDLETDGLLPELTKIHSLVIKDPETGEVHSCHSSGAPCSSQETSIGYGLGLLEEADIIVGHNIIGFDLPAIQKLYPSWGQKFFRGTECVRDTLILSRLIWPKEKLVEQDMKRTGFPKKLIGSFSLEAFGHRSKNYKGDYKGGWATWSQEMQDYCEQDVEVTHTLWNRCKEELDQWGIDVYEYDPDPGKDCVQLEHDVARILYEQEQYGFAFDVKAGEVLYGQLLARQTELTEQLQRTFPPLVQRIPFTPKRNNKARGFTAGETLWREKVVPFNPASRSQVAARLIALGWQPTDFLESGAPKVDDAVLEGLPYPEAKLLAEYFMVLKRLGQLGEGREAWLKSVRNGRLHGRVITNGAVTGRMTHMAPNMAQVPAIYSPYGKECRSLFKASKGRVLVGCDADALELRCLAHFMARYDGGEYVRTVLEGKKEEGTDMHTLNAKALGCDRDTAKTWFYAFV